MCVYADGLNEASLNRHRFVHSLKENIFTGGGKAWSVAFPRARPLFISKNGKRQNENQDGGALFTMQIQEECFIALNFAPFVLRGVSRLEETSNVTIIPAEADRESVAGGRKWANRISRNRIRKSSSRVIVNQYWLAAPGLSPDLLCIYRPN